tara:strand:+ start:163 stop:444 length:282 start_codon:yes stop_codon:yes gene_type:complete
MNNEYILEVKKKRLLFIDEFEKNVENIYDEIIKAKNDNQLSSIRVHKYLTAGGIFGKVKTGRYLDEIGLDEKTKFNNLNENDIKKLVKYVTEQ